MLQSKVRDKLALASAGEVLKGEHSDYLQDYGIVADDNVCVGCFVQSNTSPKNENEVIGASGVAITGKILGVVQKTKMITNSSTPRITFNKGDNIPYVIQGVVCIETETPCKKGQYVFLKTADGALAFDDTDTKSDHTYTGWRVFIGTGSAVDTDVGHDIIAIIKE